MFGDPNWRRARCCCEQCATPVRTVTQHSAIFRVTLAKCSRRGDSGKRDSVRALRNRRRHGFRRPRRHPGHRSFDGRGRAPVPLRTGRSPWFPRAGETADTGPADRLVGVRGHLRHGGPGRLRTGHQRHRAHREQPRRLRAARRRRPAAHRRAGRGLRAGPAAGEHPAAAGGGARQGTASRRRPVPRVGRPRTRPRPAGLGGAPRSAGFPGAPGEPRDDLGWGARPKPGPAGGSEDGENDTGDGDAAHPARQRLGIPADRDGGRA